MGEDHSMMTPAIKAVSESGLVGDLRKRAIQIGVILTDPPKDHPDADLMDRAADALDSMAREMAEARADLARERDKLATMTLDRDERWRRQQSLTLQRDEMEKALRKAQADKARLDFLDACNAALNGRYGTNYGWSLVLTHNVTRLMLGRSMEVDLHDSEGGNTKLPSCRNAIDREMTRIDVERRAQSLRARGEGDGR